MRSSLLRPGGQHAPISTGRHYRGDRFSCSVPVPATSSRHLYTGHRQGHTQAAPWLTTRHRRAHVPRVQRSLGFDATVRTLDASAVIHTCSSSRRSPDPLVAGLLPQRSPPRLLTSAACGGLGSPPARRTRRTYLHRWHSTARAGDLLHHHHSPSGHTAACTFHLRHGAPSCLTRTLGASCLSGLNYSGVIRSPRYQNFRVDPPTALTPDPSTEAST